jgi:hypothetical protein
MHKANRINLFIFYLPIFLSSIVPTIIYKIYLQPSILVLQN